MTSLVPEISSPVDWPPVCSAEVQLPLGLHWCHRSLIPWLRNLTAAQQQIITGYTLKQLVKLARKWRTKTGISLDSIPRITGPLITLAESIADGFRWDKMPYPNRNLLQLLTTSQICLLLSSATFLQQHYIEPRVQRALLQNRTVRSTGRLPRACPKAERPMGH